jgi:hypothetical protein
MDTNPEQEVTEQTPEDDLLSALSGDESEVDEDQSEETAEDEADGEVAEELEEVEFEGVAAKVPPKIAEVLKKAESLQKDYTQKTQEVAETRKAVEDKSQYLQARETILQHAFKEAAEVESINAQLQQFDSLDWNALFNEDGQRAMQLSFARQQLQNKLAQSQGKLNQVIAKAQQAQAEHLQKQTEIGRAELQRRLGKASEADLQATWKQGLDLGFSEKEMKGSTDPRLMHALYKAAKWDAMQQAKPQAMKKIAEAPKAVKPSAPQPKQSKDNRAAMDRLRKTGRAEALINFL